MELGATKRRHLCIAICAAAILAAALLVPLARAESGDESQTGSVPQVEAVSGREAETELATHTDARAKTGIGAKTETRTKAETRAEARAVARPQSKVPSFINKIADNPLLLLADRLIGSLSNESLRLEGNVRLTNEGLAFFADQVEISPQTAIFKGRVTFQSGQEHLFSQTMDVNRVNGGIHMQRALLHDGTQFVTADAINRDPAGKLQASHLLLSPCPDCRQTARAPWRLYAGSLTYDPADEQVRARHVQLNIFGTPVLSLPYWQFANPSLNRFRGFLQPTLKQSNAGETALRVAHFTPLDARQDLTHALTLHTAGAVQVDTRYRLSDSRRDLQVTTRLAYLSPGGAAQSALRQPAPLLADLSVAGDWFISGHTRLKGQGRWENNDSFGAEFGHDTQLFRPTDLVLEHFKRGAYARLSISQDRRSAKASATFPQSQIPTQFRATYETANQRLAIAQDLPLRGALSLNFRAAERAEGRDSTRVATRGQISTTQQRWRSAWWQMQAFATAGIGQGDGLDTNSDDFAPTNPDFSGQSAFSTLGLSLDARLPFAGMARNRTTRVTPRVRVTHILGEAPQSTLANEDALLPILSAGTQFGNLQAAPFDRGWTGTRLDVGLDWRAHRPNRTWAGFIGQRFQSQPQTTAPVFSGARDRQSAALIQLSHTHRPSNLNLTYLGRLPLSADSSGAEAADQTGLQTLNLTMPIAGWQNTVFYTQADTSEIEGGTQIGATLQSPHWGNWKAKASLVQDMKPTDPSATMELTASYLDCCLGADFYYSYTKAGREIDQEIGFKIDLVGLTSIDRPNLFQF